MNFRPATAFRPATTVRPVPLAVLLAGVFATLPAQAAAQDPVPVPAVDFRMPIRASADASDPGVWTSGPAYKASFHDGFTFYPVLGKDAPRNLPLRWTTVSATVGGTPLLDAGPAAHEAADWRYTYVLGNVREVYDVRADGVEQSFVIAQRPAAAGDLVICGRIDSELRCAPVAAAHQALVFRDLAGNAIVRYGEAFAIDALGRRTGVATTYDGDTVMLTVAATWISTAQFPITVDPLTSAVTLSSTLGQAVSGCDVGHQGETATRNVLFTLERYSSASDRDVYAYLCDADYNNRVLVLSTVSATWDDFGSSVAFVAGADRWIVGYIRGGSLLRVYFHDENSTTLNSGTTAESQFAFYRLRGIDLGGTYSGSTGVRGLCVYWADPTDNRPSQVGGVHIDASMRRTGAPFNLGVPPFESFDRERPSVNQVAGNSAGNDDGWLIVFQERSAIAVDDWDIMAVRTDTQGTPLSTPVYLVNGGNRHLTSPQVSGVSGYYTLTYLASADLTSASGAELIGRRVVWAPGQALYSTVGDASTIATASPPMAVLSNHGLAVNHEIATTALSTYTVTRFVGLSLTTTGYAARLSGGGAPVDTHVLFSATGMGIVSPAVTFALPGQAYQVVYGTTEVSEPLYGRRYTYPADAIEVLYGNGCGPLAIGGQRPYLGNPHYQVSGHSGPTGVPATLLVGATALSVPLDPIGMPTCMLNVDPAFNLPGTTDGTGLVVFSLPLPENVLTAYDLLFQIAYLSPGANARSVQATRGLRAQVR